MNNFEIINRLNKAVKYFHFEVVNSALSADDYLISASYKIVFNNVEYSCDNFIWDSLDSMLFDKDHSIFEIFFCYGITSDIHKELYNDLVDFDSECLEELFIKLDLLGI